MLSHGMKTVKNQDLQMCIDLSREHIYMVWVGLDFPKQLPQFIDRVQLPVFVLEVPLFPDVAWISAR